MKSAPKTRFEQEVLPHMNALYAMSLKYTHDVSEAEDLVQDTMIKAYNCFDSYEEGTNCRAWLSRILTNTFINKYRRKKLENQYVERVLAEQRSVLMPAAPSAMPTPENSENISSTCFYGFSDELLRAFNSISNEFKSILILADLEEFSYKEIAEKLHIPIGTVMSRLSRARQTLKRCLSTQSDCHDYAIN